MWVVHSLLNILSSLKFDENRPNKKIMSVISKITEKVKKVHISKGERDRGNDVLPKQFQVACRFFYFSCLCSSCYLWKSLSLPRCFSWTSRLWYRLDEIEYRPTAIGFDNNLHSCFIGVATQLTPPLSTCYFVSRAE